MKYSIETHCHSCYSHDCATLIKNIAQKSHSLGLTHLIINDHDNCGISEFDINVFNNIGVALLKGIEFTTKEGVHIIGVNPLIKKFERESYFYSGKELIDLLQSLNAYIIIPHPYHKTGLIGNENTTTEVIEYVLGRAHFIEIDNYKYGETPNWETLINHHKNLVPLIGSDAHSADMVGAMINTFEGPEQIDDILGYMHTHLINHQYNRKHTAIYWKLKKMQSTCIYQFVLHLFPKETRKRIKNILFNH